MRVPLLLLVTALSTNAYNILVYNMKFAHSHSNFLGNIADLLVDDGHNVTSLISEIASELKDGTTKSQVIRVAADPEAEQNYRKIEKGDIDIFQFSEVNPIIPFIMSSESGYMFAKQCEALLNSGVIEQLQKETFDVYIVETFDICGMMLSHLLKPKSVIKTATTILMGEQYEENGVPISLSYNPSTSSKHLDVHSPISRAWNIFAEFLTRVSFAGARWKVDSLFKNRFGSDYPSLKELSSKVAYTFTNSEPLIDFAVPTISRVVDIGGLGAKEPKELDEYWTSIMSKRLKVILLSFGSLARAHLMAPSVKTAILKVVSTFPDTTFIWKYEKPEDDFARNEAAKVENLVLTKWMPQNDLLNHPNLVAFITHGGMGSVQELALRGKPAILMPIFGDQPRNAAVIEHNGLGKVLSKLEVGNADKIIALLKELTENPKYKQNAERTAKMLAKKPFSSKEKLLKYVNFAAEFGPSPALRPQSHDMSFIAYHNLDILAVALIIIAISTYVSAKVFVSLLKRVMFKKLKNE